MLNGKQSSISPEKEITKVSIFSVFSLQKKCSYSIYILHMGNRLYFLDGGAVANKSLICSL